MEGNEKNSEAIVDFRKWKGMVHVFPICFVTFRSFVFHSLIPSL